MVARQSTAVQFGSPRQAEFSQQSPGYVGPDVRRETTVDLFPGAGDALIGSILKDLNGLAQTRIETSREEAFLRGAASAASGEAEEAVESNPVTADWERAGFRDTRGKMAMAEADANLAKEMQDLRELSPEQFNQHLNERRSKLAPSLNGMSRESRIASVGKMLISDRAAIATHATEHVKWQLDVKDKAIRTEWAPIFADLNTALTSNSADVYNAQVDKTIGFLAGTVWADPALPEDIKEEYTMQAMGAALGTGNVKLYSTLKDSGMLGKLSMKNQEKLSEENRKAMERTDGARLLDLSREESFMMAEMKLGTFKGTVDDVYAFQAKILKADPNAGGRAQNVLDSFLTMGANGSANKSLAAAYHGAGDFGARFALGVTDSEGTKYMHEEMVKNGVPLQAQLGKLTEVALKGSDASAKLLGSLMTDVVTGLDFDAGNTSASNAEAIQNAKRTVQALEASSNPASIKQFYSGMDEKAALRLKRLLAAGNSPDALVKIQETENTEATMPAIEKASRKAATDKAYMDYRENIAPTGTWSSFISNLPFIGKTQAQASLSPRTSYWTSANDNSAITNHYEVQASTAFAEEFERYRMSSPLALPEQAVQGAEEAALKRLVVTPDGPFVVPMGQDPAKFFSVNGKPSTASPEQLGTALSAIAPRLKENGRLIYTVKGKNILITEYDDKGKETINRTEVTPADVQKYVDDLQDKKKKKFDESDGKGFVVPLGNSVGVINGTNTASMANDVMAQVRKNLVKHEGFTVGIKPDVGGQKKADGTPVMTTGIGVSDTNTYFPKKGLGPNGEITPEQHLDAFKNATNEAATNAMKLTGALGLKGRGWQILTTELIYQAGIGNVSKGESYGTVLKPIPTGLTPTEAMVEHATRIKALQKTPAFTMSGKSRQKHYTALLTQALSGG